MDLLAQTSRRAIFFDRSELRQILSIYGRKVASGEWRGYALDALPDRAVFSAYRRASESPLYQIEKRPALARRQGAYCLRGAHGIVLRRGRELDAVLRLFEPRCVRLVAE